MVSIGEQSSGKQRGDEEEFLNRLEVSRQVVSRAVVSGAVVSRPLVRCLDMII